MSKYKKNFKKILNCIRFLIISPKEMENRSFWKGKNLYSYYQYLYDETNEDVKNVYKAGYISSKCGYKFVKNIYSLFFGYREFIEKGRYLKIRKEKIEDVVKELSKDFFEDPSKYKILRDWMGDDESKHLLDLEILQKILIQAGWSDKCASSAVCTGISVEKWNIAWNESKKITSLPNLFGRSSNDSYVNFARTAVFYLNQYEYKNICRLHTGDVFFDCGGCLGDTAVWALEKVGNGGGVVSFEPIAAQAKILKENLKTYLEKKYVLIENMAVSDRNGFISFFAEGEASQISKEGNIQVDVVKIDDYCMNRKIKPDYIKMDIEGSELAALKGAENVIKKWKPRLAICVYHKPAEDLWEIPLFLKTCVPTYQFFLKKSHYAGETVLFAITDKMGIS